jgi:hypothetical protein
LSVVIGAGLFMASVGMIWLWREKARPGLVDQQEATIGKILERADRQRGDLDELRHEFDEFRQATRDQQDAYEEELSELRAFIDEQWRGWQLILEQMKAAQLVPVWQPKPPPERRKRKVAPVEPDRTPQELALLIGTQFDIEEMNTLAFDIGIEPDAFGGITRQARARELVDLARRRGVLAALEKRRRELRS